MRHLIRRALPPLVTVALLFVLFRRYDWQAIFGAFHHLRPLPLAAGVAAVVLTLLIGVTDRWRLIVRLTGTTFTFGDAWLMRMGSAPLKLATPFRVSELLKAPYLSRRHGLPVSTAFGALVFEKVSMLLGYAPALPFRAVLYRDWISAVFMLGLLIGMGLLLYPAFHRVVLRLAGYGGEGLRRQTEYFLHYFTDAGVVKTLWQIGYASLLGLVEIIALAFCLAAVGVTIPFVQWLTVMPAVMLVAMAPISVAGLGAREVTLVLLFPTLEPQLLIAGSLLFFAVGKLGIALLGLLWTPVYLRRMIERERL